MNKYLMKRKLQIQQNIPQKDKDRGYSYQHFYTEDKLRDIIQQKSISGTRLITLNVSLHQMLYEKYHQKTFIVTGGCGFVGSHLVELLVSFGHKVIIFDNLSSEYSTQWLMSNRGLNAAIERELVDISDYDALQLSMSKYEPIYGIFHVASVWDHIQCNVSPIECYRTNVMGTIHLLEICRRQNIHRIVMTSSNAVFGINDTYRASKEAVESLTHTYNTLYKMSIITLRYSEIYEFPMSDNFMKIFFKNSDIFINKHESQVEHYTHVIDIVRGTMESMFSNYCGVIDLCSEQQFTSKEFMEIIQKKYPNVMLGKNIIYQEPTIADKTQFPKKAYQILGWKSQLSIKH
jgi:UDP-glucose 4-epimerase